MYKIAKPKNTPATQGNFWNIGRASPLRPRPKKSNASDTPNRQNFQSSSCRDPRRSTFSRRERHCNATKRSGGKRRAGMLMDCRYAIRRAGILSLHLSRLFQARLTPVARSRSSLVTQSFVSAPFGMDGCCAAQRLMKQFSVTSAAQGGGKRRST